MSTPMMEPEERETLRRTVREFLARRSTSADEHDGSGWQTLAGQLGLTAIGVPERHGGHGYGRAEVAVVHEEMGRALFSGPYFSTVALFTNLLLSSGDEEACAELLPRVATGTVTASVALHEAGGQWIPRQLDCVAARTDEGWALSGEKVHVIDGDVVDLLLVLAMTPEGPGVFAVETAAPGVHVRPQAVMDPSRGQSTVSFDGACARQVGHLGQGLDAVEQMMIEVAVALAAEQVGVASRVLEFTLEHVSTRTQFGSAIGSFQAVKHLCADLALDVESARALLAATIVAPQEELSVAAHAAKSFCSEAAWRVASTGLQLHGGIGFTWEHDVQRFFKRAKSSELLFGSAAEHRQIMLQQLGV